MIQLFFKLSKFIPFDCYKDVYLIDYNKLYEQGKRLILMDIDNTMVAHNEKYADESLIDLFSKVSKIGFEIIFISNNHYERVSEFSKVFESKFIHSAFKPFSKGYKKALKIAGKKYSKKEIVAIGDQLLTDVLGANRFGIDIILVNTLKMDNEKWYTKLNRVNEEKILKKLRKKYPDAYLKIKEIKE
jgi:HAD superfamily phosphatase (TIGR01668 family)